MFGFADGLFFALLIIGAFVTGFYAIGSVVALITTLYKRGG